MLGSFSRRKLALTYLKKERKFQIKAVIEI